MSSDVHKRSFFCREEISMFTLKSEIQFDMAHYLSGYEGKCNNIHGHRYRLVVKVSSETLHEEGAITWNGD